VTTFSAGATGRYRLTAETGEQRRLALGEPADVELTGLPLTLSLPLEAGQAVQIAATNCTFDASLTAVGPGLPQVFADDYTGRREPRLHLIAPQTGTVSVIVNSWSDPRGRATITATLLTPDTRIDYAGGAPSVTPLTLAPGAECLRVSVAAVGRRHGPFAPYHGAAFRGSRGELGVTPGDCKRENREEHECEQCVSCFHGRHLRVTVNRWGGRECLFPHSHNKQTYFVIKVIPADFT